MEQRDVNTQIDRTQKANYDGKLYVRTKAGGEWGKWREVDRKTFDSTKADDTLERSGDFLKWSSPVDPETEKGGD